ncbi:scarecrow-like protein 32 [Zingiber officinale]|uniref:Scarecrow-like protein 32 n=1 Tax=Zingiber officinale TaxID=94328 RepID=A0A8J5M800_ZINOF|nr:scarecrow-like protein 32 [Zingiber officinale]KAG6536670.1 hypothetical protein ZIOFF_001730 [Zingiber officinale]
MKGAGELMSSDANASSLFDGQLAGAALRGCLDGGCIEKLLLHCATALEANDATLVQQVMWVLNNIASPNGDPNQRLTAWLLRALVARAARLCPTLTAAGGPAASCARRMSVTDLVGYLDLTPWHRFGFTASNGAILKAVQGKKQSVVHVLDFGVYHCTQWPTLIDALAKRPEGPPPLLRVTVPSARPPVTPYLNLSTEEIGLRLANFAKSRSVPFEFNVVEYSHSDGGGFPEQLASCLSALELREDEAVVVNCQSWMRYLPEEGSCLTKDTFLELIHRVNPCVVTVSDEDADLDSPRLSSRIMACFNYLWIPFDALETFLPKESEQRMEYEGDIGEKIERIVSFHGAEVVESGERFSGRMARAGFAGVVFEEEVVAEVKAVLEEHASGWGMKREEDMLVLTWKGHNSVFTSSWAPTGFSHRNQIST